MGLLVAAMPLRQRARPSRPATAELPSRRQIASMPAVLDSNPYQRLLYQELALHGFGLSKCAAFTLRRLWKARRDVRFVHFHWPQRQWRAGRAPRALHGPLSWLKLCIFALRLGCARRLGYRIVWTIHQVYPHESSSRRRDRAGARLLARASHLLLAHDAATLAQARRELGAAVRNAHVVPHGSYVGAYPPGRARAEVRRELGIAPDALVFLSFGSLRAYKELELLVEAFRAAAIPGARLVIAGAGRSKAAVTGAIADDPRIVSRFGYVPDANVAELFAAADAAVVTRGDGGTSGALILALSMGLPAIVARRPAYLDLIDGECAGWSFAPSDAGELRDALEAAARSEQRQLRGRAALERARSMSWAASGERTADLLRRLLQETQAGASAAAGVRGIGGFFLGMVGSAPHFLRSLVAGRHQQKDPR